MYMSIDLRTCLFPVSNYYVKKLYIYLYYYANFFFIFTCHVMIIYWVLLLYENQMLYIHQSINKNQMFFWLPQFWAIYNPRCVSNVSYNENIIRFSFYDKSIFWFNWSSLFLLPWSAAPFIFFCESCTSTVLLFLWVVHQHWFLGFLWRVPTKPLGGSVSTL